MDGSHNITHQLPHVFPPNYEEACVWVVWNKRGGQITVESVVDHEMMQDESFKLWVLNENQFLRYDMTTLWVPVCQQALTALTLFQV